MFSKKRGSDLSIETSMIRVAERRRASWPSEGVSSLIKGHSRAFFLVYPYLGLVSHESYTIVVDLGLKLFKKKTFSFCLAWYVVSVSVVDCLAFESPF